MTELSRRSALRAGGTTFATALAGCTSLFSGGDSPVSMELVNYANEPCSVEIKAFHADRRDYHDAREYWEWHELEADSDPGDPSIVQKEDILPSDVYDIQVGLRLSSREGKRTELFKFYSSCTRTEGDDDRPTETFGISIWEGGRMEFAQNACGSRKGLI